MMPKPSITYTQQKVTIGNETFNAKYLAYVIEQLQLVQDWITLPFSDLGDDEMSNITITELTNMGFVQIDGMYDDVHTMYSKRFSNFNIDIDITFPDNESKVYFDNSYILELPQIKNMNNLLELINSIEGIKTMNDLEQLRAKLDISGEWK